MRLVLCAIKKKCPSEKKKIEKKNPAQFIILIHNVKDIIYLVNYGIKICVFTQSLDIWIVDREYLLFNYSNATEDCFYYFIF